MRNFRNTLAALVFVFALSAPVIADDGIIHTENTLTTPNQTTSTPQTSPSDGIMNTDAPASDPQATDSLTETVLSVLQTLALI